MKTPLFLLSLLHLTVGAMEQNISSQMYDIVNSGTDSEEKNITDCKRILAQGYNVNINMNGGFTLLHYAVFRVKPLLCKFLVERGANPHIEDCDNNTPLMLASGHAGRSGGFANQELIAILRTSNCRIFRPGMNGKDDADSRLEFYNRTYNLSLTKGNFFEQ